MYKHTLKQLIKDNLVHFSFFREGKAYYTIVLQDGATYEFPVDVTDIGTGALLRDDKAILFMRWIRKAITSQELRVIKL